MDRTLEKLKQLGTITPREDWVQSNKQLLMAQISAQATEVKPSAWSYWYLLKLALPVRFLNFVAKPVGALLIALLVIGSSGIVTVNAAKNSLPGDMLYGVKRTSEKMRVGLTVGDDKKAKAHVELATERVNEIEKIVKNPMVNKNEKIKVAAEGLKEELDNAKESLENVKTMKVEKDQAQAAIEIVKDADKQMTVIADRLKEQKELVVTDVASKDATDTLNEAVQKTEETSVKAAEVIVDKYTKGEVDLQPAEVVDVVTSKLTTLEEKITAVTEKETLAATVAADTAAADTAATATTTTPATAATPETTETSTTEVVEAEKVADAQIVITEAKDLLNQGDLTTALEKIKEGSAIVNRVEATLDAKVDADAAAAAAAPTAVDPATTTTDTTAVPPATTTPPTTPTTPTTLDPATCEKDAEGKCIVSPAPTTNP